jgi:endonuclease/exonuclease/phosphatase family metal-dependent hydrolase
MARRPVWYHDRQTLTQGLRLFVQLPPAVQLLIVLVIVLGVWWVWRLETSAVRSHKPVAEPLARKILFCLWNFENLFDDHDDPRRPVDEEYDNWFARDSAARQLKYQRVAEALLQLAGGYGPDIIAGNEVESIRAAELLRDELNRRLPAEALSYSHLAMVELSDAGRHLAPCLISRYPLRQAHLLGKRQRILEVTVSAGAQDLIVINSHWTSQLSDKGDDPSRGRGSYAKVIGERVRQLCQQQPNIDLLVCGDFNTSPDDPLLRQHLGITGDPAELQQSPPKLLGLLVGKSPERFGTIYYSGRLANGQHHSGPLIYDQIAVSAGMLDNQAWTCYPESVQVPVEGLMRAGSTGRRPWRFGSAHDNPVGRGYSDHFPVTLVLSVIP